MCVECVRACVVARRDGREGEHDMIVCSGLSVLSLLVTVRGPKPDMEPPRRPTKARSQYPPRSECEASNADLSEEVLLVAARRAEMELNSRHSVIDRI